MARDPKIPTIVKGRQATLSRDSKGKYIMEYNGIKIISSNDKKYCISTYASRKKAQSLGVTDYVDMTGEDVGVNTAKVKTGSKFSIDKRYEFMAKLVDMTVDGHMKSLIITGDPGTGKTYTVQQVLKQKGLVENTDFVLIKGFSTPKAMYRALYENQDSIVIFDDCDSVLKDHTAVNILKAGLDSYDKRMISWRTEKESEDLPTIFEFRGKIIFISNYPKENMNPAVISRSILVDVAMTKDEKIERMRKILPELGPEAMEVSHKEEALELLSDNVDEAFDLNIRTLLRVITVRNAHTDKDDSWKDLAEYMITA